MGSRCRPPISHRWFHVPRFPFVAPFSCDPSLAVEVLWQESQCVWRRSMGCCTIFIAGVPMEPIIAASIGKSSSLGPVMKNTLIISKLKRWTPPPQNAKKWYTVFWFKWFNPPRGNLHTHTVPLWFQKKMTCFIRSLNKWFVSSAWSHYGGPPHQGVTICAWSVRWVVMYDGTVMSCLAMGSLKRGDNGVLAVQTMGWKYLGIVLNIWVNFRAKSRKLQ